MSNALIFFLCFVSSALIMIYVIHRAASHLAYRKENKELKKLRLFKEYTHAYLDQLQVPYDPYPEETMNHGCRMGSRFRYLLALQSAWIMESDKPEGPFTMVHPSDMILKYNGKKRYFRVISDADVQVQL